MAGPETPAPAVLPVSVVHAGQRVDLALPGVVPVAELLAGMVQALGRLTATSATQGFRVLTASGAELDQSRSLSEQGVGAGALLTLQPAGTSVQDVRYDDLVEAVGTSVSAQRAAWQRDDSIQLSAYAATGLFVVAALLLAGFATEPLPTAVIGIAGALLAALTAALLARRPGADAAATAVAMACPVLAGAGASVFAGGPLSGQRALLAGGGILIGGLAAFVLPARQRPAVAGPFAVGSGLVLLAILTTGLGVEVQRAAALVVAVAAVLTLLIPWIGLAQVPARIDGLSLSSTTPVDGREVGRQLGHADVLVLSLRIGVGLLTAALTPWVAVDGLGVLLIAAVAVSNMLGTRSLRGRAEVFAGVTAGLITSIVAGVSLALHVPNLLPWVAVGALVIGTFVLGLNVVGPRARPQLSRIADTLQVIALMAVLPLTALIWGVV